MDGKRPNEWDYKLDKSIYFLQESGFSMADENY
jgi:hypothetical protein